MLIAGAIIYGIKNLDNIDIQVRVRILFPRYFASADPFVSLTTFNWASNSLLIIAA
jgi:hypothetical protein